MTKEEVKDVLEKINSGLAFIAKLTPTKIDDQVVDYVNKAIALDWPLDLIVTVINLIHRDNVEPEAIFKVLGGLVDSTK